MGQERKPLQKHYEQELQGDRRCRKQSVLGTGFWDAGSFLKVVVFAFIH